TDNTGDEIGTATVGFIAGASDAGTSTVAGSATDDVTADGTAASTITVTIRDADNNIRTDGGDDVFLSTDLGTLGAVVDNGDGTYTASLTSTDAGTATVTAYLGTDADGTQIGTATVGFIAGAADANNTIGDVLDGTAGQEATITVTVLDAFDNPVPGAAGSLSGSITGANTGTLTFVAGKAPGTYTATYTPTKSGTDNIT